MIETYKIEFWDDSTYVIRADLDNFEEEAQNLLDYKKQMYDSLPLDWQEYFLMLSRKKLGTLVKITQIWMTEDNYLDLFLEIKRIIEMRNSYEEDKNESTNNEPQTVQRNEKLIAAERYYSTN